jgi:hypothetical protein
MPLWYFLQITNIWQDLSFKVAVFGGIVGAILAILQAGAGLLQRARELRWNRAKMAKEINTEMQEDILADAALQMLDYSDMPHLLPDGSKIKASWDECLKALRPDADNVSDKEANIRMCFDSLFYFRL